MKISGESLKDETSNISDKMLDSVFGDVKKLVECNNQVVLVLGGGNFFRGRNKVNLDKATLDYMGMLSTVINALAVTNYLNNHGIKSVSYSMVEIPGIVEKFNYEKVKQDITSSVIVLSGGIATPNFTTDMVTIEKAIELSCDMILMAKNIDGIYDGDPNKGSAKKFDKMTHEDLINLQIKNGIDSMGVMDFEAISMLYKHKIPLYLYSNKDSKALSKFLKREYVGTLVESK